MALKLFKHNEDAYRASVKMLNEKGKAAVIHSTGTGKSRKTTAEQSLSNAEK